VSVSYFAFPGDFLIKGRKLIERCRVQNIMLKAVGRRGIRRQVGDRLGGGMTEGGRFATVGKTWQPFKIPAREPIGLLVKG